MLGAGAAGLMAAIAAARAGAEVIVIEKTADGGRKILISGGGRCNVLPSVAAPERFVSAAPAQLVRRMLRAFPLREQKAFFEKEAGIPLALEEESGKLFPASNRARDVRDALVRIASEAGATFRWSTSVSGVARAGPSTSLRASWRVLVNAGDAIEADAVIVATGGLSVPLTGSDGTGLAIAKRLAHTIVDTYPALTPLLSDHRAHWALAGLSLQATLRAPSSGRHTRSTGGFLFTHRGYSGPTVLDVSHAWTRDRAEILVSWGALPRADWETALEDRTGLLATRIAARLPARLAEMLIASADIPADRRMAELTRDERIRLVNTLAEYRLPVTGDEGYKKAEVTGGGLALDEVHPATLESRRHAGLYFCGEVLDAFGPIGGHNFQWAWATGRTAGQAAAVAAAR
ncbi:MAG TPA: aminoacetone oxidase family FAD-binding enzyme [Vicinamibacterales bacterium]|nr:aminoacetone oxidase family FAD-binding enzyme [Vicinamibacterales bacterium]